MSGLVSDHPDVRAVDAKLQNLQARRSQHAELMAGVADRFRAADETWRSARMEALGDGELPPDDETKPAPEVSDYEHTSLLRGWDWEEQRLREERLRTLATIRPAIDTDSRRIVAECLEEAKAALEALQRIASTIRDAQTASREVRDAHESTRTDGRTHYDDPPLADPQGVVRALETPGGDLALLASPRVLGMTSYQIQKADDPTEVRRRPGSVPGTGFSRSRSGIPN